jgi:hypothetical protein
VLLVDANVLLDVFEDDDCAVLTRYAQRYRNCFPRVELIMPS